MNRISEKSRGNQFLSGFASEDVLEDQYTGTSMNQSPFTNISESDDVYKIEIGIPGFKKSDLEIVVRDSELIVSGRSGKKDNENREHFRRHEFDYSTFRKSFQLPEMIDLKNISANYEDGILRINLPKKEGHHIEQSVIKID